MESEQYIERIRSLIKFLHRISTRPREQEFDDKHRDFRLSIILVGRSEVIKHYKYGYEPYVNYIKCGIKKGIETFYVLARGKLNTLIAQIVARELEQQRLVTISDEYVDKVEYKGTTVNVSYFRLSVK